MIKVDLSMKFEKFLLYLPAFSGGIQRETGQPIPETLNQNGG